MQKTLLTTTLAIIGSFVIGSSALAAPGVAYKRRLDVPTVPATVINQVKNLSWRYTTDKGTPTKPHFATFTKAAVKTPLLINEKGCADVIYRVWGISVDLETMRKTHPNMVPPGYGYSNNSSELAKYVIEARTPTAVKWQIDPKTDSAYTQSTFLGCQGKDLIIENRYAGETTYTGKNLSSEIRKIPYISFTNNNAWTAKSMDLTPFSSSQRTTVDGILQAPGKLVVYTNADGTTITGDSRVTTFEEGKGIQIHSLPRYRDFNTAVMRDREALTATFYRMKDGYAVTESTTYYEGDVYKYKTTYYRIRNGEAQYSLVESLPFGDKLYFTTYGKGLQLTVQSNVLQTSEAYDYGSYADIMIHGLNAGHNSPESIYSVKTTVLWETDSQVYMRYLITDKFTKKQQYWEATVSKS